VKEYARAQHMSVSDFIEFSLVKNLGLEGVDLGSRTKVPMDKDEIFGEDKKNE
jgi:hypothetical protein